MLITGRGGNLRIKGSSDITVRLHPSFFSPNISIYLGASITTHDQVGFNPLNLISMYNQIGIYSNACTNSKRVGRPMALAWWFLRIRFSINTWFVSNRNSCLKMEPVNLLMLRLPHIGSANEINRSKDFAQLFLLYHASVKSTSCHKWGGYHKI